MLKAIVAWNGTRVYVAQYSPQVILNESGVKPWAGCEPFLVQGRIVADPEGAVGDGGDI